MSSSHAGPIRVVLLEIFDILKSPTLWWALCGTLFGFRLIAQVVWPIVLPSPAQVAQMEKTEALHRTTSGAFALDHMRECLDAGPWFSASPTRAACINSTIQTARTLRGEPFAEEVRVVLADQFAPRPAQPN
jgi:hypothetical protein